jgi:hypothetical protein
MLVQSAVAHPVVKYMLHDEQSTQSTAKAHPSVIASQISEAETPTSDENSFVDVSQTLPLELPSAIKQIMEVLFCEIFCEKTRSSPRTMSDASWSDRDHIVIESSRVKLRLPGNMVSTVSSRIKQGESLRRAHAALVAAELLIRHQNAPVVGQVLDPLIQQR